ncbi:transposase [Microbulbifer sp. JMSA002]
MKFGVWCPEYKLDAARLVVDQSSSIPEATRSLNVGTTAIRGWVEQLEVECGRETPTSKGLITEQQKIKG